VANDVDHRRERRYLDRSDEHGDLVRTIVPDNVTPLANGYRVLDSQGAIISRAQRVTPELLVTMVRTAA